MSLSFAWLLGVTLLGGAAGAADLQRVTARKGAIELTLEVASTTVHVGAAPWVAVEIKNVGNGNLLIMDELFSDDRSDITEAHERTEGPGIYFEVKGPSGPEYMYGYSKYPHECLSFNRAADGHAGNPSPPTHGHDDPKRYSKHLAPSATIRTKDWVFEPINPSSCKMVHRSSLPPIIADGEQHSGFHELGVFRFKTAGKHKIRVIYDRKSEYLRDLGFKPSSENVRIATSWITFRVK